MLPPGAIVSEIGRQSALAPRHLARRDDRRKGRYAAIAPRIAQSGNECAVPAHRMTGNRPAIIGRKCGFDQRRQFLDDIIVHAVVGSPRFLSRVDVEAGALSQIIAGIVGHAFASRARVRRDEDDPVLGSETLRDSLRNEILFGASQAGQPIQHRHATVLHLGRQIDADLHRATQADRVMLIDVLPTAEAGVMFDTFHFCFLASTVGGRCGDRRPFPGCGAGGSAGACSSAGDSQS
ncbi:hypothetical protein WR25_09470 [Diploscapter pachys]|uniref:Uncharacterized protein n=1 Tax=Diploscapter pachys TaxID=2018661 RepID=A0A2A2KFT1_9BILA|nr:hypothetical protein WR25_09470 [Diploscapter pachys]